MSFQLEAVKKKKKKNPVVNLNLEIGSSCCTKEIIIEKNLFSFFLFEVICLQFYLIIVVISKFKKEKKKI